MNRDTCIECELEFVKYFKEQDLDIDGELPLIKGICTKCFVRIMNRYFK